MHTLKTSEGNEFKLAPYGELTKDMTFSTLADFINANDSDDVRAFDITLSNGYFIQVTPDYEDDKLHAAIFDADNEWHWTTDANDAQGLANLINNTSEL